MRFSKSDVRYWQERIFKEENNDYSVRIHFQGRRERFHLGPNKYEAARKAKKIYQQLRGSGWAQTLQSLNHSKAKPLSHSDATVGEFLRELRALHASKVRTIDNYASPFAKSFLIYQACRVGVAAEETEQGTGFGVTKWRPSNFPP